jgi:hypothetical protein
MRNESFGSIGRRHVWVERPDRTEGHDPAYELRDHERRAPTRARCRRVSENIHATVMTGLAKLVELVHQ